MASVAQPSYRRLPCEVLTPLLQTCLCTRCPDDGELCVNCGCHSEWTAPDTVCQVDNCGEGGALFPCGGCNVAHHRACMGIMHWGLNKERGDYPWCEDCYEDWDGNGVARRNQAARGDTVVAYNPAGRPDGPALAAPPLVAPALCEARNERGLRGLVDVRNGT